MRPPHVRSKRLFDAVAASTLLLLGIPIMALIALVITTDSGGRFLFSHERVGHSGKRFRIFKFRTLVDDVPRYSYKVRNGDARVTRSGRFLRLTGLDELPQLFNVIKGDMSLVGPRPELPFIVEQYEAWQHERHLVRPGLTGWWQIHFRNDEPMHLRTDYDIYYVRNASWRLDAHILFQTVKIVAAGVVGAWPRRRPDSVIEHPQPPVRIDGSPADVQELA